jgi:hypothetical protein
MPIYRKTAKGLAEIETRAHRLSPRLRSALIIVDGRRSDEELRPLILQQPQETLQWLVDEGFIEPAPGTSAAPAARAAPPAGAPAPVAPLAAAPAPAAAPAAPAAQAAPRAPVAGDDFTRARAEAIRLLLQRVGPDGEDLALRMERAPNADALRPLLNIAVQSVANMRGRQAAQEFAALLSAL